jgi:D-3-phosphoglycerate dehydrogenase
MARQPTVILADHTFPLELEMPKLERVREQAGARMVVVPNGDRPALLAALAEADVAFVHRAGMDAEAIAAASHLGLIVKCGIGVDTIDLAAATRHGVMVVNHPGVGAPEVADHAMALLLSVARRTALSDRIGRSEGFPAAYQTRYFGVRLEGKTMGLVGLGAIGRLTARRAAGFGLRLLAHTPNLNQERAAASGARAVDLETLLTESDIVSLHCPLTETTRGMINRQSLARMKPGAILVNTGRGGLVDETALAEALASGHLGGAGLDVFATEPVPAGHPLSRFDNLVMSPHSGSLSVESADELEQVAAAQAIAYLMGQTPLHVVNRDVLDQVRREA